MQMCHLMDSIFNNLLFDSGQRPLCKEFPKINLSSKTSCESCNISLRIRFKLTCVNIFDIVFGL